MSEQKKRIGKCIYCGSVEPPLTKEHPLPDALGGRIELEQASCKKCQCAINPWEQQILRETWGVARNKLQIKSARPRREPARPLLIKHDGKIVDIPLADAFTAILLLDPMTPPRIESGDFGKAWPIDAIKLVVLSTHRPSDKNGSYEIRFTPAKFYRLICKIAHGLAIWNHDIDYFEPILTEYIINGIGDHTQFIGTSQCEKVGNKLHSWEYFEMHYPTETYLGVKLQLFSQHVDFAYHVVVGKLKGGG